MTLSTQLPFTGEAPKARRIYDATRPLRPGIPVWPGDVSCRMRWTQRLDEGSTVNGSELCLSVHTGTHADGPFHVHPDGIRIGAAPLEAYLGPAVLVDATGREALDAAWVAEVVAAFAPERVLFRTGCWGDPGVFPTRFAALDPDAARVLVDAGVRLVGTDAPSPDPFDSADLPAHRILLGAGAGILENLLLDGIPTGAYELIALPLRLVESDGSPVRAVLREIG